MSRTDGKIAEIELTYDVKVNEFTQMRMVTDKDRVVVDFGSAYAEVAAIAVDD